MTTVNSGAQTQTARNFTALDADEAKPWDRTDWTPEGIKDWNNPVIAEFRANGGKVGGAYEGGDMILLTTTGARSGKPHTVPLAPLADSDRLIVSSFIETNYPAWYHNLRAHPEVDLQDGTATFRVRARELDPDERAEWWPHCVAAYPPYAEYQGKTSRVIPVFILERV